MISKNIRDFRSQVSQRVPALKAPRLEHISPLLLQRELKQVNVGSHNLFTLLDSLANPNFRSCIVLRVSDPVVDRPTQLICISDIYLLSWRWQPLWNGGLFYQWPVQPKIAIMVQVLFKRSKLCVHKWTKCKEQGKKQAKKPQKNCFFPAPSAVCMGLA